MFDQSKEHFFGNYTLCFWKTVIEKKNHKSSKNIFILGKLQVPSNLDFEKNLSQKQIKKKGKFVYKNLAD